ncbi:MAG: hypothetical protein GX589_03050 [Deltaproteobacteria bacterium]|nr:hypothetical protein [Deltaproteobacteria bacterium]
MRGNIVTELVVEQAASVWLERLCCQVFFGFEVTAWNVQLPDSAKRSGGVGVFNY